jgi:hypothetical protein
MKDFHMKSGLKLIIIVILLSFMSACARNDSLYQGFCRGIYEGSQQYQDSKSHPAAQNPEEKLTYDEYEKQREERLSGDENR